MIHFNPEFLGTFLGVVRKYMQLRGNLSQKDLAEVTNVGISTMSRFINLQTTRIDEQLVAKIIAALNIPLHEIIDGVEEDSTEAFKRLVQFYKEQSSSDQLQGDDSYKGTDAKQRTQATINVGGKKQNVSFGENILGGGQKTEITIREKLETLSPRQKAYLTDFLNLDVADRDLIVDLGDAIFRYFRSRNVEF